MKIQKPLNPQRWSIHLATSESVFTSCQENRLKSFREFVAEKRNGKDTAMKYRRYITTHMNVTYKFEATN